jgi:hypothetical protein
MRITNSAGFLMMIKKLINSAENNILINRFEFSKHTPAFFRLFLRERAESAKPLFMV